MWIPESLPVRLKKFRMDRGLSQRRLALESQILQARISDFERGSRPPNLAALEALSKPLGFDLRDLAFRTRWEEPQRGRPNRQVETSILRRFSPDLDEIYLPPRKKDFAFHMAAVRDRFGAVLKVLEPRFDALPDRAGAEIFLRDLPVDSAEEAVLDLHTAGLAPVRTHLSPASLGFFAHAVIDPVTRVVVGHRRRPAFALQLDEALYVLLSHVAVRPADTAIMDRLVGVREGATSWIDMEVDGGGHDSRRDEQRAAAIGLPVLRVTTEMLHDPRFMTKVLWTLLWIHRNRFRGVVRTLRDSPP